MLDIVRYRAGPATLFIAALAGASAIACASPGTGQPSEEAGTPAGGSEAGAGDDGPQGSGPGSDAASATPDAHGGSSSDAGGEAGRDAGSDVGPTGAPDGGQDATGGGEAGAVGFSCPAGPFAPLTLTGLTPTKVAGVPPSDAFNNDNNNFGIIEGPVWIGDSLCVSEIASGPNPPPSRILKVTAAGVVSVAIANSGSNGLAVDSSGALYGAVHKDGSISRFDLVTGSATPIATGYPIAAGDMPTRFNSPNDLTIRNDGNIYFSDPNDQAPSPQPQTQTRLYRVAAGTKAVSVVDATLTQPNGVTLSIDQNTLYVTSNNGLFKYPVMADGSVGASTLVSNSINGDGMAIDCAGNLYIAVIGGAGNTVMVLGPTGTPLGTISLPAGAVQNVTNVAFGGADHKTLYITALGNTKALYQVALTIPGMPY
jgi:gluconolactonase